MDTPAIANAQNVGGDDEVSVDQNAGRPPEISGQRMEYLPRQPLGVTIQPFHIQVRDKLGAAGTCTEESDRLFHFTIPTWAICSMTCTQKCEIADDFLFPPRSRPVRIWRIFQQRFLLPTILV